MAHKEIDKRELFIKNTIGRIGFLLLSILGLFISMINIKTDSQHSLIMLFFSLGFFYAALTNRIKLYVFDNKIQFLWIGSLRKKTINKKEINSINFLKHKIIISTTSKKHTLDIFNVKRNNKRLLETFFTNLKNYSDGTKIRFSNNGKH